MPGRLSRRFSRESPAPKQPVRQQAEIAAAREREVAAADRHRGQRQLNKRGAGGAIGKAWRVRFAVEIVADRIGGGTVAVAFLLQHRKGPGRARAEREGGRAIAGDRDAAGILEELPRAPHVGAELRGRERVHERMAVAVAGEFVALGDDAAHQARMALGHPAEGEEGGVHAGGGETIEDARDVGIDARREPIPGGPRNDGDEGLDLEIVLHVHRHGVADGHFRPWLKPLNTSIRRWNTRSRRATVSSSTCTRCTSSVYERSSA